MKCRINKKNCKVFLDFGKMPIANGFLKKREFKNEYFFPMKVGFNKSLSLFQLKKTQAQKKCLTKIIHFILLVLSR